jgi:hypothetical protein
MAMGAPTPHDVVRSVFRTVWEDFYHWERAYCQSAIKSLPVLSGGPHFSNHITLSHKPNISKQHFGAEAPPQPTSRATDKLTITFMDYTQGTFPIATIHSIEVVKAPKMTIPPAYESVTPTTRSIHQGDDDDSMAFVPYSDDHTFNALENTLQYSSFSWQDKFCDPDGEDASNVLAI